MDRVTRYVEIWSQLREVFVNERPTELREEFDDIWNRLTDAEKLRLDKILENLE